MNEDSLTDGELTINDDGSYCISSGKRIKLVPSRLHTLEDHNYWVSRFGKDNCPYCKNGSRPAPKDEVIHELHRREGDARDIAVDLECPK